MTQKKKPTAGPFETLRALKDELARKGKKRPQLEPAEPRDGTSPATPERGRNDARTSPRSTTPPSADVPSATPERGRNDARTSSRLTTPPSAGAPSADDDEALLLHRLFAGVKPLDRAPGRVPRQQIGPSERVERVAKHGEESEADAVHEHLRVLVEGSARFEVTDDGQRIEGRRVDLPLDMLRRLRRGRLPVDARLDLHGLGVREARAQLEAFLRTMRSRGERCLIVIHGKGAHSPQGTGVLRGEIGAWLSQGSASEHVAAFATATAQDGGEGAVYVLLRR
jgi:DNA-nicking Smr family endonuclease